MEEWIVQHPALFRTGLFGFLFLIFSVWEIVKPDHKLYLSRKERWISNISLVVLNNILVRYILPISVLLFSDLVWQNNWGLLPALSLPISITIFLSIVSLDFIIYLQHVLFHSIPVLWKLHRMHHADLELDVTSGIRFHPLEILISMGIKFAAIFLLGVPPIGVLIFEIILNGMAMFNHSNIYIPVKIERALRTIFVTPSMHRIHHSIKREEYNSNFGFNLSIWDHLMLTFKEKYQNKLVLGLPYFRDTKYSKLNWMLAIPFIEETE